MEVETVKNGKIFYTRGIKIINYEKKKEKPDVVVDHVVAIVVVVVVVVVVVAVAFPPSHLDSHHGASTEDVVGKV